MILTPNRLENHLLLASQSYNFCSSNNVAHKEYSQILNFWRLIFLLIVSLTQNTISAQGTTDDLNCPKLKITNETCCITPGSTININWTGGCSGDQIDIDLFNKDSHSTETSIVTGISNSGHYTWIVPGNMPPGSYAFYVENVAGTDWEFGPSISIQEECEEEDCNCQPDFSFQFKDDGCSVRFTPKVTENCTINKVLWDFGDGNSSTQLLPIHTYTASGRFLVCLTITYTDNKIGKECIEKICKEVNLETCTDCCPVIPLFIYDIDECKVQFTSLNQRNDCSKIILWNWDFGDGSPNSNQTNPSHLYAQNGTYKVCLTATIVTTDGLQFETTICRKVVIDECRGLGCCPIKTDFEYDIVPDQLCTLEFEGIVYPDSCENSTRWSWDFGDGSYSNLQSPTHVFPSNGAYIVCLEATHQVYDTLECQATHCDTIFLINCEKDSLACSGMILSQTNPTCNSNSGGSAVVQGVGGTPPYTYILNGNSQLTGAFSNLSLGLNAITITDVVNCTAQVDVNIVSEPFTSVTISGQNKICKNGSAQLIASPQGTFQWSPANSLSCAACPNPIATPSFTTTYTVNHIDLNGCMSSDLITVAVGDSFVLNIPDQTICLGETVFLNPNPNNGNYLWQPSAGLSCHNCPNPQTTLSQSMTYLVSMSDGECFGIDTVNVFMHPSASIDFSWTSLDQMPVTFNATLTNLQTYSWDFGDPDSNNNSASGPIVSHEFSTPNKPYTVCLTVTDECGPIPKCHSIFIDKDCVYESQPPK